MTPASGSPARVRPADPTTGPVDGALLRRARLEANLSESAAAEHAGLTPATLRLLEERGGPERVGITLPQLQRLTARLGLTVPDVWREQVTVPTEGAEADARTLGALLHHARRSLRLVSVARSLGWDTDRAEAAADALRTAAAATGAAVVRAGGNVGFAPVLDTHNDRSVAALQSHADHARGMDPVQAAFAAASLAAHRTSAGDGTRPRMLDAMTRRRFAALLRKGVLECGPDGQYRPSPDLVDAVWSD